LPVKACLRRQIVLVAVVAAGLVAGCLFGLVNGMAAVDVMQSGLVGAGMAGGLVLLWRFLLVLVSLDPDKPRAVTRQNRSASRDGSLTRRRS
jgi:hypothetical protein